MGDNMSPADFSAIMGSHNNGAFGNGDSWAWLIIILLALGGFNGNGFGGYGGGYGYNDFAWLSNGQKEIMQNTNNGFDTLHLSNQIEGTRDAIHGLSNQLCSSTADVTGAITNGFYGAEISANSRQMANMQQAFDLSRQFADCCCENRLATCQTQNIVQNEGNATRFADANNTRDIITNATANTQAILDKLCQLELDGKQDRIDALERELSNANLRASQLAQTEAIKEGIYNEFKNCPVGTVPVFRKSADFYLLK